MSLKMVILIVDVTNTIRKYSFCINFMRKGMRAALKSKDKVKKFCYFSFLIYKIVMLSSPFKRQITKILHFFDVT